MDLDDEELKAAKKMLGIDNNKKEEIEELKKKIEELEKENILLMGMFKLLKNCL